MLWPHFHAYKVQKRGRFTSLMVSGDQSSTPFLAILMPNRTDSMTANRKLPTDTIKRVFQPHHTWRNVSPDGTRRLQEPVRQTIKWLALRCFLAAVLTSSSSIVVYIITLLSASSRRLLHLRGISYRYLEQVPRLTRPRSSQAVLPSEHASEATKADTSFRGQFQQTSPRLVRYIT